MGYSNFVYLAAAVVIGGSLAALGVPAGWLIGAILTGIYCRFFMADKKFRFPDWFFKGALALVGANVSSRIGTDFFSTLYPYLLPTLVSIVLILATSLVLTQWLRAKSGLDPMTCFFACLPGGASEAIGSSREYGADQNVVAAFHTTRIMLFVFSVPFLAGFFREKALDANIPSGQWTGVSFTGLVCALVIVYLSLLLTKLVKIPAGTLIYAMLLGFVMNLWIPFWESPPKITAGLGQAFIGAVIGLRFDRNTLVQLRKVGMIGIAAVMTLLIASFGIAFVFSKLSSLDYPFSLLATVPAGAGEMVSTAYFFNMDVSLIAAIQTLRIMAVFVLLPFLARFYSGCKDKGEESGESDL